MKSSRDYVRVIWRSIFKVGRSIDSIGVSEYQSILFSAVEYEFIFSWYYGTSAVSGEYGSILLILMQYQESISRNSWYWGSVGRVLINTPNTFIKFLIGKKLIIDTYSGKIWPKIPPPPVWCYFLLIFYGFFPIFAWKVSYQYQQILPILLQYQQSISQYFCSIGRVSANTHETFIVILLALSQFWLRLDQFVLQILSRVSMPNLGIIYMSSTLHMWVCMYVCKYVHTCTYVTGTRD